MHRLKRILQNIYPDQYTYLTGSGTTALYIAIKALGIKNKRIVIPNNVCFSVPLAVLYSGNFPLYLDIEKENLGLSPAELVRCKTKFAAVIAVHAYGNICAIEEISSFCRNRQIPLIEDCAVAQGIDKNGRAIGTFGDISILSFGAGKIIDISHGGALMTKDIVLFKEFIKIDACFEDFSYSKQDKIDELSSFHTKLYNTYFLNQKIEQCSDFWNQAEGLKENFLYQFSRKYENKLIEQLQSIGKKISQRQENARTVSRMLSEKSPFFKVHNAHDGSAVWRLILFVNEKRNDLFWDLLCKKFKISSWHPSVDIFFGKRRSSNIQTPISDWVGEHILNIWVNHEIDDCSYLQDVTREINEFNYS